MTENLWASINDERCTFNKTRWIDSTSVLDTRKSVYNNLYNI